METGLPDTTSPAADEGTKLHQVMNDMIMQGKSSIVLTDAQQDMINWCLERVEALKWQECRIMCEQFIDLKWLHPTIGGGTADLVLVEDYAKAIVVDFKFGRGKVQSVHRNLQLACYAEGIRKQYDLASVEVCILQPALDFVDLAPHSNSNVEQARDIASRTQNPEAALVPGVHCLYCKASGQCPAQMALAEKQPEAIPATTAENVALLPMSTISDFVAHIEDCGFERILAAMRSRLYIAVTTGYEDDNWTLGAGRPRRGWTDDAVPILQELVAAKGVSPNEIWTAPELKSPAQIEKIVGKSKAVKEKLEPAISVTAGEPKLERKSTAKDGGKDA